MCVADKNTLAGRGVYDFSHTKKTLCPDPPKHHILCIDSDTGVICTEDKSSDGAWAPAMFRHTRCIRFYFGRLSSTICGGILFSFANSL